jgi:Aspartyl protease
MIRYRYAQQMQPPAPFVHVAVRCLVTNQQTSPLPALVDSAADRTVLTKAVVDALGLVEDGRLLFQGFAGEVVELPIFLVEIRVHDFAPVLVRAVLGEYEPYLLLGRDILNFHEVCLKGPQQVVDIDRPTLS